ncbi:hypothetical protein RRG08_055163 [Elysia crispata]|uniref:Uncharacterized protein n=1 Tax=Elysia crispata TaxID=231223 RepID=A0AAE0YJU5_9GAST|nr:hypothetical protein RRG08_055163 [Elysia crispata]
MTSCNTAITARVGLNRGRSGNLTEILEHNKQFIYNFPHSNRSPEYSRTVQQMSECSADVRVFSKGLRVQQTGLLTATLFLQDVNPPLQTPPPPPPPFFLNFLRVCSQKPPTAGILKQPKTARV